MSFDRTSQLTWRGSRGQSSWQRGGGGRGNRGSRGGAANYNRPRTEVTLPDGPFGKTIDSIDIKAILIEDESPVVSNVEYVASYNWLDGSNATILVPGSPPAWNPLKDDVQLKPDKGIFYRDTNAAHAPNYPMEPAIRSLLAMKPDFDLQTVDIVGCGSTLGNLLRYARSEKRPFRFDADMVGDTVFFVRREVSPTAAIEDIHGYGHTFPEHYTTWDIDTRGSVSHQRIIQYDFGGLRCLVRTETDGYVKDGKGLPDEKVPAFDLEDDLNKLTVTDSVPSGAQKLQLNMKGHEVHQSQIFDIKTRAKPRDEQNIFDIQEILPRLWLNQTSRFLLAYHTRGVFDQPQVQNIRPSVEKWEKDNAEILSRLHATLRRIVDVLRDSESQQVEISWDGKGAFLITKQIEVRRALPSDLCV